MKFLKILKISEKMDADDYNLKWNNFETGITSGLIEIFNCNQLYDVTLVCGEKKLEAHRLVLSACSPVFRGIFTQANQTNPIVYLRGISFANLEATVKFMYHGEVCIGQDKLSEFLSTAEDLRVKGLSRHENDLQESNTCTRSSSSSSNRTSTTKKRPMPFIKQENGKRKRSEEPQTKKEKSPISDRPVIHQVESLVEKPSDHCSPNHVLGVPGPEMGVAELGYEEEDYDYDETFEIIPQMDLGAQLYRGPKPKADRLPIVNFINLNKLKVENGYMCSFCNRVSADNSNMNRHIEVKHAAELELYLMQPSEMNQL
ncbi:protein tramtrack, beta isoform [Eurytemora carolleeae]|uniref:protein tramtrack, beta isoform n=1 Tax=Eurytemora carolleeae TaxID=1294199 RepID=UPI000C78F381|nr:protein tramtrack, beta isoform [Eurytemora carolleeae]|eukprot:XP_023334311.1 protein tramtrack, beta isoform-like [Eurytemora affinis]